MWRTLDGPCVWWVGSEALCSRTDVENTSGDDEVKWQRCKRSSVATDQPGAEEHPELQHCSRVKPECIYLTRVLTLIHDKCSGHARTH